MAFLRILFRKESIPVGVASAMSWITLRRRVAGTVQCAVSHLEPNRNFTSGWFGSFTYDLIFGTGSCKRESRLVLRSAEGHAMFRDLLFGDFRVTSESPTQKKRINS